MSEVFEIYISDLTEDCKKRLLCFLKIKSPSELNLDVFPIAEVPKGDVSEEA